jgi:hypothetical protein
MAAKEDSSKGHVVHGVGVYSRLPFSNEELENRGWKIERSGNVHIFNKHYIAVVCAFIFIANKSTYFILYSYFITLYVYILFCHYYYYYIL